LILGGALTQYAAPAQLSRVSLGGLDRYGSYYEQRMHVRRQARNHVLGLQRLGYKVTLHSPRHRPETRCRPAWSLTAIKQGGGDNASAEAADVLAPGVRAIFRAMAQRQRCQLENAHLSDRPPPPPFCANDLTITASPTAKPCHDRPSHQRKSFDAVFGGQLYAERYRIERACA